MSISILFSVAIYHTATYEVGSRLDRFRNNIQIVQRPYAIDRDSFISDEKNKASINIIVGLFWQNVSILIGGGLLSYLLAKRTLRTIEEAHEAQTRFTSDASHELRTPLAVIKTEIEVALGDKKSTKDELTAILKSNLEEVNRLTTLSNMLLNLSRLDDRGLEMKKLNALDVTKKSVDTFGNKSKRIDNNINKRTHIMGDAVAIQDLISVLLDNALKYSPKNSAIKITSATKDKLVNITVTNQGVISEETLPYIFDRFYRADESRSTQGFGLGLSRARKISEAHNGDITVDVAEPGQVGFTITLPKA